MFLFHEHGLLVHTSPMKNWFILSSGALPNVAWPSLLPVILFKAVPV